MDFRRLSRACRSSRIGLIAVSTFAAVLGPAGVLHADDTGQAVVGGPGDQSIGDVGLASDSDDLQLIYVDGDGSLRRYVYVEDLLDGLPATIVADAPANITGISADGSNLYAVLFEDEDFHLPSAELTLATPSGLSSTTVPLDLPGLPGPLTLHAAVGIGQATPDGDQLVNVATLHLDFSSDEFLILDRIYAVDYSGAAPSVSLVHTETIDMFSADSYDPGELEKEMAPDRSKSMFTWSIRDNAGPVPLWNTTSVSLRVDPDTLEVTTSLGISLIGAEESGHSSAVGEHSVAVSSGDTEEVQAELHLFDGADFEPGGTSTDAVPIAEASFSDPEGTGTPQNLVTYVGDLNTGRVDHYLWMTTASAEASPNVPTANQGLAAKALGRVVNHLGRDTSPFFTIFADGEHDMRQVSLDSDPGSGEVLFGGTGLDLVDSAHGLDALFSSLNLTNPVLETHVQSATLVWYDATNPTDLGEPLIDYIGAALTGDAVNMSVTYDVLPSDPDEIAVNMTADGNMAFTIPMPDLTPDELDLLGAGECWLGLGFDLMADQAAIDSDAKFRLTFESFAGDGQTDAYTVTRTGEELGLLLTDPETVVLNFAPDFGMANLVDGNVTWELIVDGDPTVWIDNFAVWVEPVPEPAAACLLGVGMLMGRRR